MVEYIYCQRAHRTVTSVVFQPVCLVSDELTVDQPFAVLKAPKVWGALHGGKPLRF